MNPTLEKFGYPATLVAELEHWNYGDSALNSAVSAR
jgi:hypothetical protein